MISHIRRGVQAEGRLAANWPAAFIMASRLPRGPPGPGRASPRGFAFLTRSRNAPGLPSLFGGARPAMAGPNQALRASQIRVCKGDVMGNETSVEKSAQIQRSSRNVRPLGSPEIGPIYERLLRDFSLQFAPSRGSLFAE